MKKNVRAIPESVNSIVDQTLARVNAERENLFFQKNAAIGAFRKVATDLDQVNCRLRNIDSECEKLLKAIATEQVGVQANIAENDKIISRVLSIIGEE